MMGRNSAEQDSTSAEDPRHQVTLAHGFWLGKYELTKRQWFAVMETTPWSGKLDVPDDLDGPAQFISRSGAQEFITALNDFTGLTFRLPSEAEWEYACRTGDHSPATRFYWGDDPNYREIGSYAWYNGNSDYVTHTVGGKQPNAWGLYDMSGNVREWVQDVWHWGYGGAPTDGSAWETYTGTPSYVERGGGCYDKAKDCRSAMRYTLVINLDSLGFRLAR